MTRKAIAKRKFNYFELRKKPRLDATDIKKLADLEKQYRHDNFYLYLCKKVK